jgi:small conductance mechanosensitive channel
MSKYEVIIEQPSFLGVTELADSSINMRIIAKTKTMQHFQVERDLRRDLVLYLNKHDIEIPFPQVVVHNA